MRLTLLLACLVALVSTDRPLEVEVARRRDAIQLTLELVDGLPRSLDEALPSGAVVRVAYPVRVRSSRWLLWDRRVWKGTVIASVAFDPVIGRYRCQLVLDEVIIAGRETAAAEEARRWLVAPPAIRLALPAGRHEEDLRVRVRAVFSSTTSWLVFPSVTGTAWVEVPINSRPTPTPEDSEGATDRRARGAVGDEGR